MKKLIIYIIILYTVISLGNATIFVDNDTMLFSILVGYEEFSGFSGYGTRFSFNLFNISLFGEYWKGTVLRKEVNAYGFGGELNVCPWKIYAAYKTIPYVGNNLEIGGGFFNDSLQLYSSIDILNLSSPYYLNIGGSVNFFQLFFGVEASYPLVEKLKDRYRFYAGFFNKDLYLVELMSLLDLKNIESNYEIFAGAKILPTDNLKIKFTNSVPCEGKTCVDIYKKAVIRVYSLKDTVARYKFRVKYSNGKEQDVTKNYIDANTYISFTPKYSGEAWLEIIPDKNVRVNPNKVLFIVLSDKLPDVEIKTDDKVLYTFDSEKAEKFAEITFKVDAGKYNIKIYNDDELVYNRENLIIGSKSIKVGVNTKVDGEHKIKVYVNNELVKERTYLTVYKKPEVYINNIKREYRFDETGKASVEIKGGRGIFNVQIFVDNHLIRELQQEFSHTVDKFFDVNLPTYDLGRHEVRVIVTSKSGTYDFMKKREFSVYLDGDIVISKLYKKNFYSADTFLDSPPYVVVTKKRGLLSEVPLKYLPIRFSLLVDKGNGVVENVEVDSITDSEGKAYMVMNPVSGNYSLKDVTVNVDYDYITKASIKKNIERNAGFFIIPKISNIDVGIISSYESSIFFDKSNDTIYLVNVGESEASFPLNFSINVIAASKYSGGKFADQMEYKVVAFSDSCDNVDDILEYPKTVYMDSKGHMGIPVSILKSPESTLYIMFYKKSLDNGGFFSSNEIKMLRIKYIGDINVRVEPKVIEFGKPLYIKVKVLNENGIPVSNMEVQASIIYRDMKWKLLGLTDNPVEKTLDFNGYTDIRGVADFKGPEIYPVDYRITMEITLSFKKSINWKKSWKIPLMIDRYYGGSLYKEVSSKIKLMDDKLEVLLDGKPVQSIGSILPYKLYDMKITYNNLYTVYHGRIIGADIPNFPFEFFRAERGEFILNVHVNKNVPYILYAISRNNDKITYCGIGDSADAVFNVPILDKDMMKIQIVPLSDQYDVPSPEIIYDIYKSSKKVVSFALERATVHSEISIYTSQYGGLLFDDFSAYVPLKVPAAVFYNGIFRGMVFPYSHLKIAVSEVNERGLKVYFVNGTTITKMNVNTIIKKDVYNIVVTPPDFLDGIVDMSNVKPKPKKVFYDGVDITGNIVPTTQLVGNDLGIIGNYRLKLFYPGSNGKYKIVSISKGSFSFVNGRYVSKLDVDWKDKNAVKVVIDGSKITSLKDNLFKIALDTEENIVVSSLLGEVSEFYINPGHHILIFDFTKLAPQIKIEQKFEKGEEYRIYIVDSYTEELRRLQTSKKVFPRIVKMGKSDNEEYIYTAPYMRTLHIYSASTFDLYLESEIQDKIIRNIATIEKIRNIGYRKLKENMYQLLKSSEKYTFRKVSDTEYAIIFNKGQSVESLYIAPDKKVLRVRVPLKMIGSTLFAHSHGYLPVAVPISEDKFYKYIKLPLLEDWYKNKINYVLAKAKVSGDTGDLGVFVTAVLKNKHNSQLDVYLPLKLSENSVSVWNVGDYVVGAFIPLMSYNETVSFYVPDPRTIVSDDYEIEVRIFKIPSVGGTIYVINSHNFDTKMKNVEGIYVIDMR